jgi:hypothetical protein
MSLVLQAGQRVRIQPVYLLQTGHLMASPSLQFFGFGSDQPKKKFVAGF